MIPDDDLAAFVTQRHVHIMTRGELQTLHLVEVPGSGEFGPEGRPMLYCDELGMFGTIHPVTMSEGARQ